jgi:magnesium chelatase family protein
MLAKVLTCAVVGLDGQLVEVEVDIPSAGMPHFTMVGTQHHPVLWRAG